jgi:hypothetical protein
LLSVAAGAFGEGAEGNSILALALHIAEPGARGGCGQRLAVFPGLQREIQFFAEAAVGAEEAEAHGHGGDADAVGGFLGGVLQDIAEQADLAQLGSELLDGVGEVPARFAAGEAFFGIVCAGGDAAAESFFTGADGLFHGEDFAVTALADDVDGGVGGDAGNPGVKIVAGFVLAAVELVEARNGLEKGFLADVFGFGGIAREAQGADVEGRAVGKDELGERFAVTFTGLEEQAGAGGAIETDGCAAHNHRENRRPSATAARLPMR